MNKMIYTIATSTILILIPLFTGIVFALDLAVAVKIIFAVWSIGEWVLIKSFVDMLSTRKERK